MIFDHLLLAIVLSQGFSYEISDLNSCQIVKSKVRGTLTKFYDNIEDPNCLGKVRFKQDTTTYCLPRVNGMEDILHCQVDSLLFF